MRYAAITGWGKGMPKAVLSNDDLATFLDTSDEWITSRTGIRERRINHLHLSDMAYVAAARALDCAGLEPNDIDMIILASCSPEQQVPNGASRVQRLLGAERACAFDMNAACSGFLYALANATAMIRAGAQNRILVIGAEHISSVMNWQQREVAVLFGDGAGAAVLEPSDEPAGLLASKLGCDAQARDILAIHNFGTGINRLDLDGLYNDWSFEGQEIFKRATRQMGAACEDVMQRCGLSADDINLVIPHQANLRIIEAIAKRAGIPMERVMVNVNRYGNTSAATVAIALCEALEEGRVKPGDHILSSAFGGGLTWGAALFKWGARVTPVRESKVEFPDAGRSALEILRGAIDHYRERATDLPV